MGYFARGLLHWRLLRLLSLQAMRVVAFVPANAGQCIARMVVVRGVAYPLSDGCYLTGRERWPRLSITRPHGPPAAAAGATAQAACGRASVHANACAAAAWRGDSAKPTAGP